MAAIRLPSQVTDIRGLQTVLTAPAPVATRGQWPNAQDGAPANGPLSNGSDTGATYRLQHVAPNACTRLALRYVNNYGSGIAGPNPLTVSGSIEIGGAFYPLWFNGSRAIVIAPGALVTSDPLGIDLAAGASFYTRTYVQVTSGQKWPVGILTNPSNGEGNNRSATPTDLTLSGSVPAIGEHSYGPAAIVGVPSSGPQVCVAIVGDSIAAGKGDTLYQREPGFAIDALGLGYPYIQTGLGGELASQFATLAIRESRMRLLAGCTHAIVNYGTNDLNGGAGVAATQAALTSLWQALAAHGMKVYQCTVIPRTASTDSWATLGNQTQNPNYANYVALNTWIRTTPSPLTGVFETADALESARNSGLWKVTGAANGYTNDGIHPVAAGHALMAAAINPALLKL